MFFFFSIAVFEIKCKAVMKVLLVLQVGWASLQTSWQNRTRRKRISLSPTW